MIAPDMATMLAFVFTDAAIPAPLLQALLAAANDALIQLPSPSTATPRPATPCCWSRPGRRGIRRRAAASDPLLKDFRRALEAVMIDLAQQIVRDGEGAEKFVTITVTGARSARAARRVGLAVGNSPLVKTALAAGDANWGRIVMAVGKSGEEADRDRLAITRRRRSGSPPMAARCRAMTRRRSRATWPGATSRSPSIWGWGTAGRRYGPAT